MGREIKRVALDFDYPINKMIWKGYHNPYRGLECEVCNGTGNSPEYRKLHHDWYGCNNPAARWCDRLTQDDVQALLDADRLRDFTRTPRTEKQHTDVKKKILEGGNSWLPYHNGYTPTADEVNAWAKQGPGHDAIDQHVCVVARLAKKGITQTYCPVCNGEGMLWPSEEYAKRMHDFKYVEPPAGEGYQLWRTTTEGTPMSPVFETPEALARWLADNNASSFGSTTATYDQWLAFILGPGWAPSGIMDSTGVHAGIECAGSPATTERKTHE